MFYWPGYRVSSLYGQRGNSFHKGVDFDGAIGDPINVASNGKVKEVGYSNSFGNYVVVEHYDVNKNVAGYTLYAHMDNYTVKAGDPVRKGDEIGQVGNTGAVDKSGGGDGSHLHFEVRPVDPNNPLTDVNGDGIINWKDAEPVDPLTFTWDTFGGVYNYIYDLFNGAKIPDSLSRYFTRATQWRPSSDPLTLDLDGDGIETVGINTNNPILFDHDADGVKTATGWVKGDDGLLVLDRNNNGVIDNGRELFGDSTAMSNGQTAADGFAALADLDSNADGVIDGADAQFGSLKVWRDLNQDGISQANELSTLEQQNIASISLTTTQNNQLLGDGNRIMDLGTYTKTDGTTGTTGATGQTGDVDFAENTFYTDFTDSPPITPEAELLPNMEGSGLVRDLREAASIRGDLANVLNTYASAGTRAEQIIKGQKAKGELSAVSF